MPQSKKTKNINQQAASRIQSAAAKSNGGRIEKGSFASRASSAASRNKKSK